MSYQRVETDYWRRVAFSTNLATFRLGVTMCITSASERRALVSAMDESLRTGASPFASREHINANSKSETESGRRMGWG